MWSLCLYDVGLHDPGMPRSSYTDALGLVGRAEHQPKATLTWKVNDNQI